MSLEVPCNEFFLGDDERISINREIKEGLLKKYPNALVEIELPSENETVVLFPGIDEDLSLNVGYERDITEISYKDYGVIYENYHRAEKDVVFAFENSRIMLFTDQGLLVFGKHNLELLIKANILALLIRDAVGERKIQDYEYYPFGVGSLDKKKQNEISTILRTNNILNGFINDIKKEEKNDKIRKIRKMKEDPKGFIKNILRNM